MRILDIVPGTSVDGPGLRTSIYFAGCRHECPGCHNPQSWDFDSGQEMSIRELLDIIIENDFDVTFTGGDPIYSIDEIMPLASEIRKLGKTIWCYTGFHYEQLMSNPQMSEFLDCVEVLVDGPFIEAQRDVNLLFRGSANQRLIDIKKSTPDSIVEWEW